MSIFFIKILADLADVAMPYIKKKQKKHFLGVSHSYDLRVWKVNVGRFLDLPDKHTRFREIGPAILKEFGKYLDTRILYFRF